jgi:hypothetical protein
MQWLRGSPGLDVLDNRWWAIIIVLVDDKIGANTANIISPLSP